MSKYLTVTETAALYGKRVKCLLLCPQGVDWSAESMKVTANFLKEMELGSIKEVQGKKSLTEGKIKANVKPVTNTAKPEIKPAPQKTLVHDETGIMIPLKDGSVYYQRFEPKKATDTPLAEHEEVILSLHERLKEYEGLQKLQELSDKLKGKTITVPKFEHAKEAVKNWDGVLPWNKDNPKVEAALKEFWGDTMGRNDCYWMHVELAGGAKHVDFEAIEKAMVSFAKFYHLNQKPQQSVNHLSPYQKQQLEVGALEAAIDLEKRCLGKVKIDVNSFTLGAIWVLEHKEED